MSLDQLKQFAQELGISLDGLEERASAVLTRLMQNARVDEEVES